MQLPKRVLLAAALSGGLALSAAGQTRRIAHFSHGGSAAALAGAAGADNFGYITQLFIQEVRSISDSTVVRRGYESVSERGVNWPFNDTIQFPEKMSAAMAMRYLNHNNQLIPSDSLGIKYIGLYSTTYMSQPLHEPKRTKYKKPANRSQATPTRPFQYNCWQQVASMAALGAVGWLLGRKPKTV